MESKVKSHISNKTYISVLDVLEEDDKDLKTELYMIPISGRKIMVAPGKSRMDENGIAFCYLYAIQRERVITKLGVYEKKSDSMPLIFDISTFPEGSFCLFEEFEKNPSKLIDLEMREKETKTVFDFLISEFPKIDDKKKTLKSAYKTIYELLMKEENKKDKDIKPILKVISTASKEDNPTDAFLYTLKDNASDKTVFVYTLLSLQYVFKVEFRFKTDNEKYQEIKGRWSIQDATSIVEVDVDTYEIVEPEKEPINLDESLPKSEFKEEVEDEMKDAEDEMKEEPPLEEAPVEDQDDPLEETASDVESIKEPNISLDVTPKILDLDEVTPNPLLSPIAEEVEISKPESEPKKTRKTRTPKSESKPKAEPKAKAESKAKTKPKSEKTEEDVMKTPLGTSLNMGSKPIKVAASKKIKVKSTVEKGTTVEKA